MPLQLDPQKYPLAAAYQALLPLGLQTHPQCTARSDATRHTLQDHPGLLEHAPAGFRAALEPLLAQDMLPDTWNVVVRLMVRDVALHDDERFLKWNLEMSSRVFATPLYRVLMRVLSPSLVITNASKRWNAFRTGTLLAATWAKNGGDLTLTYPTALYPNLMVRAFAESFRAALLAAHAKNVRVAVTSYAPEKATYAVSWE